jgi:hypothetical protein
LAHNDTQERPLYSVIAISGQEMLTDVA